jgi:hypothetical protein
MKIAYQVWRAASERQQLIAGGLLLAACVYLIPFVDRGWVPLDEGMMGQSAERVLHGQLPHVDYEESYPGALSYFYAEVFRFTGIDSVHLRWTVFCAALASLAFIYVILRRYLQPISAAIATWVSMCWTFPNYFSSLPSWWVLLFALMCLWSVIRYIETDRLLFAVLAGVAAGIAFTVKQTGAYLLPPLIMSMMICPRHSDVPTTRWRSAEIAITAAVAAAAFALVLLITRSALGSGELVYLIVPVGASCAAFALAHTWSGAKAGLNWTATTAVVAGAALPVVVLVLPHIFNGSLDALLNGIFVLPQKRLQFTRLPMRPGSQIVAAIAGCLWVFWSPASLKPAELRLVRVARWVVCLALAPLALRSHSMYTFIWEAVRGTATVLPIVVLWVIVSKRVSDPRSRLILFASSALFTWASLGQFPFAAPIYFLYVVPLALIAGVVAVQSIPAVRRLGDGPATAAVLLFALLSMHRGYVWNIGWFHEVHDLSTPLDLPRAHLYVADYEAAVFKRVIPLVQQHLADRGLMAGPDTPDIYFLTGQFSPSGRLFDFFSGQDAPEEQQLAAWTAADVIVVFHGQRFSPHFPETFLARLRREFPKGESVLPFEVRWR